MAPIAEKDIRNTARERMGAKSKANIVEMRSLKIEFVTRQPWSSFIFEYAPNLIQTKRFIILIISDFEIRTIGFDFFQWLIPQGIFIDWTENKGQDHKFQIL